MKERLTKRIDNKTYFIIKTEGNDFYSDGEDLTFNYYDKEVQKILDRLAELEDKIEDGTLVELPCKVGTIVYTIHKEDWTAEYTILASRVKGFSDYGDGLGLRFVLPFGSPAVSLVGDRVFFARS